MHDFEYQITNSIFVIDIRNSIFELPLFFILLGPETFFGIRKVTEYQVFNIKTNFAFINPAAILGNPGVTNSVALHFFIRPL